MLVRPSNSGFGERSALCPGALMGGSGGRGIVVALVGFALVLAAIVLGASPAGANESSPPPTAHVYTYHGATPVSLGTAERPSLATLLPGPARGESQGVRESSTRIRSFGVAAETAPEAAQVFRVVGPEEAADIAKTGAYRSPAGLEGKYFFPTRAQAENLGQMYTKAGIGAPYRVTSGTVARGVLDQADAIHAAGEGPGFFFQNPPLQQIFNVTDHGPIP